MNEDTRALGAAAALGFGVLVVLLVVLVISEENIVGTAAGLVAIVTGILLGLFLRRTEPDARGHGPIGPHDAAAAPTANDARLSPRIEDSAPDATV